MLSPRSILSIPGSNPSMIAKGLASNADAVFLDLEDGVAPDMKADARLQVIEALIDGDWCGKAKTVRVNALDTPWFYRDVIEIVEQAGDHLDALIVPKVQAPADVVTIARLLDQVELAISRQAPIRIEAQIESARGLVNCEDIAGSSSRVRSLIFGPGDFAGSTGMPTAGIGVHDLWDEIYDGHRWHYVMSRILISSRAYGLLAIDGPFADFRDVEGLQRSAQFARALGYDGKWCIHPAQIETINQVFTPSPDDVARARKVIDALGRAGYEGKGAVALDGQMLDAASIAMARETIERWERFSEREGAN